MANQQYKGSLTLEWYNKNKSIILRDQNAPVGKEDIPAPKINWINKDQALFYEIDEAEGRGVKPYWVDRNDIRVKETRPLIFQKAFKAVPKKKELTGQVTEYKVVESNDDPSIENILIRGDNLLALNTLKKMFDQKPEEEKVKCIYIDPPYNIGTAFKEYEDNLLLSEWLTLMHDRLPLLRDLLAKEGIIFVSIDDVGLALLRVLMNEVFGKDNYCGQLVWEKKRKPSFLSAQMGSITEYIIAFAKNKDCAPAFVYGKVSSDETYPLYNAGNPKSKLKFPPRSVKFIAHEDGAYEPQEFREETSLVTLVSNLIIEDGYNKNELVIEGEWRYGQDTIQEQLTKGDFYIVKSKKFRPRRVFKNNGNIKKMHNLLSRAHMEMATYEDAADESIKLFGKNAFSYPKPEKLIYTLINAVTEPGDIVLDSFCGSGTTVAVAQKMNRKWIGIEIGIQADTHIAYRLQKVLTGEDANGISEIAGWHGGGSFKYYHLGPSIINVGENGKGDFHWQLGRQFIEESLLSSYDYVLDNKIQLPAIGLFEKDNKPKVGVLRVGSKAMAAVCSLNEPGGQREMMNFEEIEVLYKTLKKNYSSELVTIFTNRGVEMALDSKPEDLEIIKVPHAIFAELEK